MNLIPFLIAAFLLINPLLEWVFRKLEIQAEKLQFWVMLTTGTAWVIGLVYALLDPERGIGPIPGDEISLLPRLAFSMDRISGLMILAAVSFILVNVLTREGEPRSNAWLAGLGGACVIGLESNSAYTFGLTWMVVEAFHFYISYQDRQVAPSARDNLPIVFLRLSAPSALILFSFTENDLGSAGLLSDLTGSRQVYIITGLIGFLGWFLSFKGTEEKGREYFPGAAENWIPAMLGLYLILRGAGTLEDSTSLILPSLILSIALFIVVLAGVLLERMPEIWFLACGLLVSVTAISSGASSALSWCLVMMLPGTQMWIRSEEPKSSIIPLVIAMLGLLPLPFLPAWPGTVPFSVGVPGIILGISYGILLGSVLIVILKRWGSSSRDARPFDLLEIIGIAAILISQFIISFKLDLISLSQNIFSKPITLWSSILGLLPILILGNHLPLKTKKRFSSVASKLRESGGKLVLFIAYVLDQLVELFSRIFEGQAGLIWALIIGLLLITLIGVRGG